MESQTSLLRTAFTDGVNTSIELFVTNAEAVFNLDEGELGADGLAHCMLMADGISVAEGEAIKEMYTDVYPVSVVRFSALLDETDMNQDFEIKLKDVVYVPDGSCKDFFQHKIIAPHFVRIITISDMDWRDCCKYKIEFSLTSNGTTKNYSIDPFLRGNSG